MIPQAMIVKWILPKLLDHMMKAFKLDKVLSYVEQPNELDRKVEALEARIDKLES